MVNWDVEIAALRDMSTTACRNHQIAAAALVERMASAHERDDGALEQKVLTAKIAAESVAALEDLGALAWAVATRSNKGVLRAYLGYKSPDVDGFYQTVMERPRVSARMLLNIPADATLRRWLNREERRNVQRSLEESRKVLKVAARGYRRNQRMVVRAYNKIKHGFVVVQRLDALVPGQTPPTDWAENVNILTGIQPNGSVEYIDLERSAGMIENRMAVIDMCAGAWKEIACLLIYLSEREVPLTVPAT